MFNLIFSLLFATECVVLTDFCLVLSGRHFKLKYYGLTFCLLFTIVFVSKLLNGLAGLVYVSILPFSTLLLYLLWLFAFHSIKSFETVDDGKRILYGNKRIMVIVPHQDDEINVLGGVFEEYIKYGSEVMLVYAITNGQVGGYRYEEALALCRHIGIPEKNVFFLGYGSMRDKGEHLPTQTQGTLEHPAYHEGKEYSRKNMVDDISQLILEKKPDIIFGSDYDYHIDHHLVSICIDEAIGQVLKKDSSYRPKCVKCYAYRTTWESYPDYYQGENIRSTLYMPAPVETYRWEDRLRFPVSAHILCRSLLQSEIYQQYAIFKSQGAVMRAINTNTDKVGWERRTDSVLLDAIITTTSGDGSKLNDFLLYDKKDMSALDEQPLSGAWIPDADDSAMEATFSLSLSKDISYIDIYNNPSENERVDSVKLLFEDGSQYDVMLEKSFVRSRVYVNQHGVKKFTLKVTGRHGSQAGITEVEAFEKIPMSDFSFIKLMNSSQDFIYDYWMNRSGEDTFYLYTQGNASPLTAETYQVEMSNPKCKAAMGDGIIKVSCPRGESSRLKVENKDGQYGDTVIVSNPSGMRRRYMSMGKRIESVYYDIFQGDQHRKATTLSILAYMSSIVHKMSA